MVTRIGCAQRAYDHTAGALGQDERKRPLVILVSHGLLQIEPSRTISQTYADAPENT